MKPFHITPRRRRTRLILRSLALVATGIVAGAGFVSHAGTLRAGAATACVTPALGTLINGGLGPGVARHIHDDLYARALVLDNRHTRLAFAIVDTCVLDRPVVDEAKALIQRRIALPPARVLIAATHTHSAGAVCGAHLTEADPAYRAWLPRRVADAVQCAVNNLAPARVDWGRGSLPQHVLCRRLFVKPGWPTPTNSAPPTTWPK